MEKNVKLGLADLSPSDEYNYFAKKLAEQGITPGHPDFKPAVGEFLEAHGLGGTDYAAELGNLARVGTKAIDYTSGVLRLGESLGADVLAKVTGAKNYEPTTYEEVKGALAGPTVPESAPGGFDVASRYVRAVGSDPSEHPIITAGLGVASDMLSPGMLKDIGNFVNKRLHRTDRIADYVNPDRVSNMTAAEMRAKEKEILSSDKGKIMRDYGAPGKSTLSPGASLGKTVAQAILDAPGLIGKKISDVSRKMVYEDMDKLAEQQPYVSLGTKYRQTQPEADKISNFIADVAESPRSTGVGAFTEKGRSAKLRAEIELADQKMNNIVEKASKKDIEKGEILLDPTEWVGASKQASYKNATSISAQKRAGAAAAESSEELKYHLKPREDIAKIKDAEDQLKQMEEYLAQGGVSPKDPLHKKVTKFINDLREDINSPMPFTLKQAIDRKKEMQHLLNEINAYDPAAAAAVAPLTEALAKRSSKLTEIIEDALDARQKGLGGAYREANKNMQKLINVYQGERGYVGMKLTKEGKPVTASSNALIPIAYAGGNVRAGGKQVFNPMAQAYMLTNVINMLRAKGALTQIADVPALARVLPEAGRSTLMEVSNKLYDNKNESAMAKARARKVYGGLSNIDYIPLSVSPEVLSAWEEAKKEKK